MFPLVLYPPPILMMFIALFAVAEGWLLLDIEWIVLFFVKHSYHSHFDLYVILIDRKVMQINVNSELYLPFQICWYFCSAIFFFWYTIAIWLYSWLTTTRTHTINKMVLNNLMRNISCKYWCRNQRHASQYQVTDWLGDTFITQNTSLLRFLICFYMCFDRQSKLQEHKPFFPEKSSLHDDLPNR